MEEYLKGLSQTLDKILDIPMEEWGSKQIQLYNVLQHKLQKYKPCYCEVQFRLDQEDIKKNVRSQPWYEESRFQKTIDWYLKQMVIKSYHHSSRKTDYKIVMRFTQILVEVTILRKDKLTIIIESPKLRTSLSDPDKVAEIFNLTSKKITSNDRDELVKNIEQMISEVAIFYDSET